MRRLQQVLVIVGFLVLSAGVQHAMAATTAGAPPATPQAGANTFIQPPPGEANGPPLLFESYGIQDYSEITGAAGSGGIGELNPVNDVGNIFADIEANLLYATGFISARLVQWAFSIDLVNNLGGVVDNFTHSLESGLYGPYLPIVLIVAGAICAYVLLVMRRLMGGLGGLLWAGAALAIAAQLFIAPSGFLNQIDGYATGLTSTFVLAAAKDTQGAPIGTFYNPSDSTNYEVSVLANQLWTVAVYDPWTMVEFGTVDPRVNGDQLGIELLKKNAGQSSNYDQDIQQAPQWIQDWANGNQGVPRMIFAGAVVLAGFLTLLLTMLIALAVIVAQLTVILLGCLTLPAWLLAPLPHFGLRLIMRWFAGIVVGFVVSTLGSFYLVLMLTLTGAVNALAAQIGLVTVGVLDIAFLVGALWLRKALFSIGKHSVRLPMALAGAAPESAGHQVDEPHAVVRQTHSHMGMASRSVVKPLYPKGSSLPGHAADGATVSSNGTTAGAVRTAATAAGKKAPAAGARKAAAVKAAGAGAKGAATSTGTSAAAAGTAGAVTGGLAIAGYAAARGGQAAIHGYERMRRRTVSAVSGALGHPIPMGKQSLQHKATDPLVAHAAWQYGSQLRHRVSKDGTKPLKGQRVKPLEKEPVHAGPPESQRRAIKGKTRQEPKK